MTSVFKSIPAILLSMPLTAQSPQIRFRIDVQNASGYLLHVGKSGDPLYTGLQALLMTDGLAEILIGFGSVQTTSPDYAKFAKELGLARDSKWALTDGKGRCILQGDKLPSAEEIQNALDAAGVKSQIRVLRDFLKQYPDHLDARLRLLERLRPIAENRTRYALQLDIKSPIETGFTQDPVALYYFLSFNSGVIFDTSPLEGKQLSPEQDIVIWGLYAQELQTLFANGDWRTSIHWPLKMRIPFEACSPTMIQIYKRHLAKIEARLEGYPSNIYLWQYYAWALSITKQKLARALIDRLVLALAPYELRSSEGALRLLISEERAKNNWGFIAEMLISSRSIPFLVYVYDEAIREELESEDSDGATLAVGYLEVLWRDYINPLLESLIRTNRVVEAEKIGNC